MVFAIISTLVLIFCSIIFFVTPLVQTLPFWVLAMPFVAMGLVWLYTYLKQTSLKATEGKKPGKGLRKTVLVLFYLVSLLIVLPITSLGFFFIFGDAEKVLPPRTFAAASRTAAPARIAIVYHPGASGFTGKVLEQLAAALNQADYTVELYSAHRALQLNPDEYQALGFASPVYSWQIRPPLRSFIERNNFAGRKCFIVLCGSVMETTTMEIDTVKDLFKNKNCIFIGASKYFIQNPWELTAAEIAKFARELKNNLP